MEMPNQMHADLSALIDSTDDFIWSVDDEYRLLAFNAALQSYYEVNFGVQPKVGMRPEDLVPRERAAEWHRRYRQALTDGPFQAESMRADGRTNQLTFNRIISNGKVLGVSVFAKDITELKAAERARVEAEKNYSAVFNGALEGIYQTTIGGEFLSANPALARILGYDSPEEMMVLVKDSASQIWADPKERSLYLQKAQESGSLLGYECQLKRKDGTLVWISLNGRFVSSPDGQATLHEGFITDITDRKRAEIQLRDSEERYRATFEQASVGMIHTSLEGRIIRCNERFADMVGYRPDELRGRTFQEITAPEDLKKSNAVLKKMTAESTTVSGRSEWEKRYVRKDGSLTWVKLTISIQRDNAGHPLHYITVVEDINARKTAEERLLTAQQALQISEERYRTTFEMSTDAVVINRLSDGVYIDANRAFLATVGYERHEVIEHSSLDLGIWAEPDDRTRMVEALQSNSVSQNVETKFKRKNGEIFWGIMSASLIEVNGIKCVLSVSRDISEDKAAEQKLASVVDALRSSEERYRTVFQTCFDGILINRLDNGMCIDVNQMFLTSLGFERGEVIGKTLLELGIWVDVKDRANLLEILQQETSCNGFEARFRKKNGETLWGMVSATLTEIDGIQCLISITRDISDAKAAEKEIRNLAFFDQLTGLPNRRMLLDRLRHALAAGTRTGRKQALLFVDLDNFKDLNDSLGHQTGDLILQQAAARLSACVREADTVARLGGDEFVVMLEDLSSSTEEAGAQAKTVGEKILRAVAEPYSLSDREYFSSCSIGITLFGDKRESTSEVLQQADIAMYQSKSAGRNTIRFFEPALQNAVNARASMEEELRQAIRLNQFELFYQPQVNSTHMIGAEALVRWIHPKRGLLSPGEFISLAEQTGLILPLGEWVLESACKQLATWGANREMSSLSIAVNISTRQFCQSNFVDQVVDVIVRTGANPKNLRLELTESLLVEDFEEIVGKMNRLKAYGLRFALDDFGTGYSSLNYLRHLPLDQLKIDRSFVENILEETTSGAIAQTIVSLGKAMSLPVMAEGVETEAQRDYLLGLGCHTFQGYLFSKPLPSDEFEQLVFRARPRQLVPIC
jgi:diguanylate cyclase (GGDEF)-like protein/PAS domain S-box-containing protein